MAIEAAYVPTFHDFLAVNRWIVRRKWRALRYLSAVMAAVFLASPFLFHNLGSEGLLLPYAQSLAILFLPAAVLALLPVNLYIAAKKRWNAAPEIREPRRYAFSEEGIAIKAETFSGRVAWSHITGAGSLRGLYLLKTNQNQFYLLSERGFPCESDREAFLALVRMKVSPTFGRSSVLGRIKFLEPCRNLGRGA